MEAKQTQLTRNTRLKPLFPRKINGKQKAIAALPPESNSELPFRVRWECDAKNRYYEVHVYRDLFGDWILMRVWGRRSAALGNSSHHPCASYKDAIDLLREVAVRREKREYRRVDIFNET